MTAFLSRLAARSETRRDAVRCSLRCVLFASLSVLSACEVKGPSYFEPSTADRGLFLGSVSGTVTVNSKGFPGATLTSGIISDVSDASGTYKLSGLFVGVNAIALSGVGQNASCSPGNPATVQVSTVVSTRLDFNCTVPTTGTVKGIVTVNGVPRANVPVTIGSTVATTLSDGSYSATVTAGTLNVSVSTATLATGGTCSPSTQSVTVAVLGTSIVNFSCTEPTTGSVTGTVIVNGAPAPGVTVSIGVRAGVTNASGVYRIDVLAPGSATVSVTIENVTCSPSTRTVTITLGGLATADFSCTRVPTLGGIIGVVTIQSPSAGIAVTAGARTVLTNSSGVFLFDSLPAGSVSVSVIQTVDYMCTPAVRTVTVIVGQNVTADFTCNRITTGSIGGRITWDGASFVNQQVVAGGTTVRTASDGTYLITGLPAGTTTVALVGLPMTARCTVTTIIVTVTIGGTATANFSCTTVISFTIGMPNPPTWIHLGTFSQVCAAFTTFPIQANTPYSATLSGPSVLTPTLMGTTSATGMVFLRFNIGLFGTYIGVLTILNQFANFSVPVTAVAGTCSSN